MSIRLTTSSLCSLHLPRLRVARLNISANLSFALLRKVIHRDQSSNDIILLIEPLLPTLQRLHLIPSQILQLIQRPIQVLCQHILIEATARQSPAGIPSREVRVRTTRAVEVASARDIKYLAAHGEVHGSSVLAVVGEERVRGVGSEDDGRRRTRECCGCGGAEGEVDGVEDGGEEDDVEGREDR